MNPRSNQNAGHALIPLLLSFFLAGFGLGQTPIVGPSSDSGLGGNSTIVGSILTPSGQRMQRRLRVRLSTMTRGNINTLTDENGSFVFRGLVSGNYTVTIDKEEEYEPFSQQVDIIQFRGSPPQTYTLNIRLTSKKRTDAKPGVVDSQLAKVPQNARDLYAKGMELADKRDYAGAITQLQLAVSAYPEFMLAFNEIGVQYLRLNDLEKAEASFRSALRIEPDAFAPLMNCGIALVSLKRYSDAETMLRNAVKNKQGSAVGHYFLGQAVANLGRFDEAEKELLNAINLGGNEMKEAHRFLAIIYSSSGKKEKAAEQLETYLRIAPRTPDAEHLRNTIRRLRGQKGL